MSSEEKQAASSPAPLTGATFLEELESKHNHVLDELDALNARIENVLKLYVQSRQATDSPAATDAVSNPASTAAQVRLPDSKAA